MVVAVLGAAGFLGSNLSLALAKAGHSVRCFDKSLKNSPLSRTDHANIRFVTGDFFSQSDLAEVLDGSDVCLHLVGTSVPATADADPARGAQENIVGSVQLLDAAVKAGVKKIIFPSSGGAVYGPLHGKKATENHVLTPRSAYGVAKLAVENYLRLYHELHGLDYCILRIANAYGPFQRADAPQGLIGITLGRIARGEPVCIWGDGSVIRDYLYTDDVVRAFLAALQMNSAEKIFNIGSGTGVSVNALLSLLRTVTQKPFDVEYTPARNLEIPYSVLDTDRARRALRWVPHVDLEQGLERTWRWLQNTVNTAE